MTTSRRADPPSTAGASSITLLDSATAEMAQRLRRECRRFGFALFTVPESTPATEAVTLTAQLLTLGRAHVPPMYRNNAAEFGYDGNGLNTIAPETGGGHRFFGTGSAQGFHTDGTLEALGAVPTSVLWFEQAASRGGHTTIFRAVDAFSHLMSIDPDAAVTLTDNDALTRTASSTRPPRSAVGPAFRDLGHGVRTRWADDGSQQWKLDGSDGARRAAAVAALRKMSQPGSTYRVELSIPSRTGVVLRNDVVAHGRTAFVAELGERILVRGLFTVPVVI